ncbi:MAG: hypothetical protein ABI947_28880 [Chloroflexota bacterium]
MPRNNNRFTEKEDRQAEYIKESEEDRGRSEEDAERIAHATVNKQRNKKKDNKKVALVAGDFDRHGGAASE